METLVQKSARFEFARRAEMSADLRQRLLLEMNTRVRAEQDKTARETERRRDTEFVMALQGALAPAHKIADFTVKLDRYDTATVQALMDNERDVLAVREKIDAMMLKAHVLPDGRRVFKTEDGTRVFDEFGAQLNSIKLPLYHCLEIIGFRTQNSMDTYGAYFRMQPPGRVSLLSSRPRL